MSKDKYQTEPKVQSTDGCMSTEFGRLDYVWWQVIPFIDDSLAKQTPST